VLTFFVLISANPEGGNTQMQAPNDQAKKSRAMFGKTVSLSAFSVEQ